MVGAKNQHIHTTILRVRLNCYIELYYNICECFITYSVKSPLTAPLRDDPRRGTRVQYHAFEHIPYLFYGVILIRLRKMAPLFEKAYQSKE